MIRVKICGITRSKDAVLADELGAWAVGFVFAKESPRYIEPDKASQIIRILSQNIEKTGVFVNSSIEEIAETVSKTGITKIQLHGDESPKFCRELLEKVDVPIIKAFRIKDLNDLSRIDNYKGVIYAVLLDSYSVKEYGGTGKAFNWDIAAEAKAFGIPVILAGGLNSDNVVEAYETVKPWALDISSGVEKEKGIKDHDRLEKLFSVVKTL